MRPSSRIRIETFDGVGVAFLRDAVIISWTTPATDARVRWAFDMAEKGLVGNPLGVVALQLIAPSSSPPKASARKIAQERFSRNGHWIRRIVTVPLGDDLWTSIVRTIMRGVFLVSGHSKRHFAASKAEAIDLLLGAASEVTPTRHEIEGAIVALQGVLKAPSW